MKFVEIYKLQNNGNQKIIAVCHLVSDSVVCEGDQVFLDNLNRRGIKDYLQLVDQKLFPKDGLRFLENLKYAFKSGYLNASEIKEKN